MSGNVWQLQALKFDRKLHYTIPVTLVEDRADYLTFHAPAGSRLQHFTRGFVEPTRAAFDAYFWRDEWYNVYLDYKPDMAPDYFYCNVSLPPEIDYAKRQISFVDLDLDLRVFLDGSHEILDEDEFEEHKIKYRYPAEVQRKARAVIDEVLALVRAGAGPFSLLR